jgi:hypothetical protein
MDMRVLKIIAPGFGLSAVTLAGQDVNPTLATGTSSEAAEASEANVFWLHSKTAFGGGKFFDQLPASDLKAIGACADAAWCRRHFGRNLGPDDLEELHAILGAGRNPANLGPR